MANNQLGVQHVRTGQTVYAIARNLAKEVARQTTTTCVAYATANLADYAIALTEQGIASRYYAGTFLAFPAGSYDFAIFEQAGGSPAEGDLLIGTGSYEWDGAAFMSLSSIGSSAGTIGALPNDGTAVALLKRLVIENDTADPAFYVHNSNVVIGDAVRFKSEAGLALYAVSQESNAVRFQTNGDGGCIGLVIEATGTDGNALYCNGAGDAVTFISSGGHGVISTGGTNKDGFHGVGNGTGVGFRSTPDAAGWAVAATVVALAAGAITNASIADGAITDAKIALPAEGTGQATGILAMMRWLYNRFFSKHDYDKVAGTLKTHQSDGTTLQTTQTVTTDANNDVVGKAS